MFLIKAQLRDKKQIKCCNRVTNLHCAFYLKHCKFTVDLNFKSFITLLFFDSESSDNKFIFYSRFFIKSTFYIIIIKFTFTIFGIAYISKIQVFIKY